MKKWEGDESKQASRLGGVIKVPEREGKNN